ncbi:MAG: cytidylate kinase-like family protein [Verrucomicrobiae bacterium]|nr:cytidylate kinase-like family protein [Verrucomicrobiae bacterium]
MSDTANLAKCLSYIDAQVTPLPGAEPGKMIRRRLASITLSRQAGSGGRAVAEMLATWLQQQEKEPGPPWTVFDRNLVEKVLEDHHLPQRLAEYMPEDRRPLLDDIMEELLGLHPPSWTLFHQTCQTILHLATLGHAIILGRGAHLIAARLDNVVHVRLVGSLERRIERVCAQRRVSPKEARELIEQEDRSRAAYVKKHFGKDVEDTQHYHLVINTDLVDLKEAVQLIGWLVRHRQEPPPPPI